MSEKVRLRVRCNLAKSILSEVLAIRQLIADRDIGDIVAAPVEDWIRASPQTIKLTVQLSSNKQPPFKAYPGKRYVQAIYNIPDVDPKKLTWANIKKACGGASGYSWGRFRATANLDNGRQMQIYGGTAEDAETRLRALLALSTAHILTLSITEEKKEGRRASDKKMYKATTKVYPAYFSIINTKKIIVESEKEMKSVSSKLAGNFKRSRTKKIPLWTTKEPGNVRKSIQDALTITSQNK